MRKIVFVLVFLFFLIRLPFLDKTFLLYDERDTVLTQYSLAKTGKDLYGNKTPLTFSRISPQAPILAMYYGVPFWSWGLPKTVSISRLIYMLPATLIPFLVYELLYAILKRKKISLLTAAIFSFSPWVFHISRLALEINLAFPLFLVALLFQVKRKLPLSYLFYTLTFFSYQGIRPLILVMMIAIELFAYLQKKELKPSAIRIASHIVIFIFLLLASFAIEGNFQKRGSSEIVFFSQERLAQEINHNREISLSPNFLKTLFDNKIVAMTDYLSKNILSGINITYLFRDSDYVPVYSNGVTGQFYPILALFLLFGLFALGKNKRTDSFFVGSFALFGLVSSVINIYSLSFSIRSLFSGIGFAFIISLGIIEIYSWLKQSKKLMYYGVGGFLILLVVFQAFSFYYRYTFQRPVWQAELYNESERKLALYLLGSNTKYSISTVNPFSHYLSYLFLSSLTVEEVNASQHELNNKNASYRLKNNTFYSCKINSIDLIKAPALTILDEACLTEKAINILENSTSFSYETILYSDVNPLRSGKGVKFYIFN
ncbi:hypothetical protein HZC27_02865 [Candidatus Roizmanbacteria bacterium]|nr:hypothetical protein [Candidatus Roizmanbacteria bacterium]